MLIRVILTEASTLVTGQEMDIQDIRKQLAVEIQKLTKAYEALAGITVRKAGKRRRLSPDARERIAAAQRKRWAKQAQGCVNFPVETAPLPTRGAFHCKPAL